jgi:RHS repeat-associated protein
VLTRSHEYWPFGEEITSTVQESFERVQPMKFTGHERDYISAVNNESTDYLDYMHARYYAPMLGRFLSVDPVLDMKQAMKSPQGWNRYAYVLNNPMRFNDPSGRYVCRGDERACKTIDLSLQLANEAVNGLRDSDPRKAELQKVIKAYGALGDTKTKIGTVWANPPATQTGAPVLKPGELARAGRDGNVFVSLTNVLAAAQGNSEKAFTMLGGSLMHEGKHELQPAVVGLPIGARPSFLSMVFYERQGYVVEQGYYEGLGQGAMAPDPTKGAFGSALAGCNTPQGCNP